MVLLSRLTSFVRELLGELDRDQVSLVAGGVAFFAVLAMVPALAATFALYGYLATPESLALQLSEYASVLPLEARQVLLEQVPSLLETTRNNLGLGAVIGIFFAIWSASTSSYEIINAIQVAYGITDSRGFVRRRIDALVLACALLFSGSLALILIGATPRVLGWLGFRPLSSWLLEAGRWGALTGLFFAGFALLYRVALHETPLRRAPIRAGALASTLLWAGASVALSAYLEQFGTLDRTYGTLGGVAALMLWFYVSAIAILLGAEINAVRGARKARSPRRSSPSPSAAQLELPWEHAP